MSAGAVGGTLAGMHRAQRQPQTAAAAILAALSLASCVAAPRDVTLVALDARSGEPVAHAHVRATPMRAGMVPLPISEETLEELLTETKVDEQGFTDGAGRIRLRLMEGRPHLISANAPPFTSLDAGEGGDEAALTWWSLSPDMASLVPSDQVEGTPVRRRAIVLRLAP